LLDVVSSGNGVIRARSSTGSGTVGFQAQNSDTGTTITDGCFFGIDGSEQAYVYNYENTPILFGTNNTERMRITSGGEVLVGGTTAITSDTGVLTIQRAGAVQLNLFRDDTSVVSTNFLGEINFYGNDTTSNTPTRLAYVSAVASGDHAAGDNPTDLVFGTTADGSATVTARMRIDSSGNLIVGKTNIDSGTAGGEIRATGFGVFTCNADIPLLVNRLTDDGILVTLRQASVEEGSISVSGTTVSYNGGHLSRWSQLPDNSKDDTILKGTVLTNLDDMCVWVKDGETLPNEQLNKMKVSDVEGDTNVAGVFVNWTFDEQCQSDDMNVAMTGDMIIRIAEGVVVQKGDLLMSAGDGTAKPQGDDIVRSKTIAKVTSNHVTCTYADGSYCVPCVLMAC